MALIYLFEDFPVSVMGLYSACIYIFVRIFDE